MRLKQHTLIFRLIVFLLTVVNPMTVLCATVPSEKRILVLYKERDPNHDDIVRFLTGFLEQAGYYTYDPRDIEALLTTEFDMTPYSGIMTCYQTSQMIHGDRYPLWLVRQMEAGRRILIIGNYGAYQSMIQKPNGSFLKWNESTQVINTFFHPFGLEFYFAFTNDPGKIIVTKADKEYAQFQDSLTQEDIRYYQLFKSVHPDNNVYFELERTDMLDSKSAINVITPFGGMILEGYAYYWDPGVNKNVLRVNFVQFMKEVFSAKSPKVPKYEIKSHSELIQQNLLPERPLPDSQPKLQPTEIPRYILVPYKKSEVKAFEEIQLFQRAALVLEYLGIIPVYWAVEDGLPDDDFMERFRGIVTWHTKPYMVQAQKYGDWLLRQIKNGKRVVILQDYGATYDLETQEPVSNQAKVFKALGIKFIPRRNRREQYLPEVDIADMSMLGFERKFDSQLITYEDRYTSIDVRNKIFLSFNDRELGIVDLGIITPNGGICMNGSAYYLPYDEERINQLRQALKKKVAPDAAEKETFGAWIVNPYWFFSETLGLDTLPTPDITTLNGSRIFYAHIDGDAFESISLIDKAHLAGFFVYEEILKKFDDIPTTVSVITKPIEMRGNEYYHPMLDLARKIFVLPNIDMAVHSATHPFNWVSGDPYITNPGEYPYDIGKKRPDLVEEIWGAKLFADHNLAPPNKETETIFWSGATNPDVEAMKITWRAGIHNINGGDPRYDDEFPFLVSACPYSRPKDPFRQYLTSAQNDYVYSNFLRGDWGGIKKVLKHYDKTDAPYRIYPMNLYYHFYAGIKKESLDALRYVYNYIRSIDAAPISVKQYLEIAEDYYHTHIGYDGRVYWVENNGFLRTIRFNKKVHVDIEHSRGVIGYSYHNDQTYVHLNGNRYREIVLSQSPPTIPYVIQATQFIDQFQLEDVQVHFTLRGYGRIFLKIGGLKPTKEYQIALDAPGKKTIRDVLRTNREGVLEYRTQLSAPSTSYKGVLKQKEENEH